MQIRIIRTQAGDEEPGFFTLLPGDEEKDMVCTGEKILSRHVIDLPDSDDTAKTMKALIALQEVWGDAQLQEFVRVMFQAGYEAGAADSAPENE